MKNTIKRSDIVWNYLATIFNMGFGVVALPILLYFLDTDHLGIWYIMMSVSGISSLFTFGFTPAFARNVNYAWNGARELKAEGKSGKQITSETNYPLLFDVLTISRLIYLIIALVATLIIGIFGTLYIVSVTGELFETDVKLSWAVLVVSLFVNLYYGYYSVYLTGIGEVTKNNQIMIISYIVRLLIMLITMMMGMGLVGATLAYFMFGLVNRILCKHFFFKSDYKLKNYRSESISSIAVRERLKDCFITIWHNAWRDGVVSVGEYIATQISTIVCSIFFSLSETAMFSLTAQLVGLIGRMAKSIYNIYAPVFQKTYITGDMETCRESKAFCQTAFVSIFWIGVIALIFPGRHLINIIKPDAILNIAFIIEYSVYQFALSRLNCYAMFLSATNRVIYWKSLIITRAVVLLIYSILLKLMGCGPWGIIAVSIMGEFSYNFWHYSKLVKEELNLTEFEMYRIGVNKMKLMLKRGGRLESN